MKIFGTVGWHGAPGISLALVAGLLASGATSRAQSIGPFASPGRAAYRPQSDWNNGPFYTVNHVNPYAPHQSNYAPNLNVSLPSVPPYTNGPHGFYGTYTPGRGTLYPYEEGFSPYSGYSAWYQQAHGLVPTRSDVVRGRDTFFRSAPRPPAGVLPPLPPAVVTPPRVVAVRPNAQPRPAPVQVLTPGRAGGAASAPRVMIYRSSVTGAP